MSRSWPARARGPSSLRVRVSAEAVEGEGGAIPWGHEVMEAGCAPIKKGGRKVVEAAAGRETVSCRVGHVDKGRGCRSRRLVTLGARVAAMRGS